MTPRVLQLVVEGRGEVPSVPLLVRRRLEETHNFDIGVGTPFCGNGRGSSTCEGGLEGQVLAVAGRPATIGVLVFLDSDSDLACELGPELRQRALAVSKVPVEVCLAECQFEDWIYASAETLGLDLTYDPNADGLAKIKTAIQPAKYIKPAWQPRLTGRMDLQLASSRSPSLGRCLDKIDALIA